MDKQENFMHLIYFASAHIPRVVRSIIAAETYQLQFTVESLDLVRAAIIDIKGKLNHRNWEMSAASQMQAVWYIDCRSSYAALTKPTLVKPADKRLGIEIVELRRLLWRRAGDTYVEARLRDRAPQASTELIRWVDTRNMQNFALQMKF